MHSTWLIMCVHHVEMTQYVLHVAHCVCTFHGNDPLCTSTGSAHWVCYFKHVTHYALHEAHCVCNVHGNGPLYTSCGSLCVHTSLVWPIMHSTWLIVCIHIMKMTLYALCVAHCVHTLWKGSVMHSTWLILCIYFIYTLFNNCNYCV